MTESISRITSYFLLGLSVALGLAFRMPVFFVVGAALLIASLWIELSRRSIQTYMQAGHLCQNNQDFAGAIAQYTQVIQRDPNYAEAYSERGKVRYFLGDRAGAMEDCSRALVLDANQVEAYLGRSLLKIDTPADALADCSSAIAIIEAQSEQAQRQVGYAKYYAARGTIRNLLQDYSGALADSTHTLSLDPTYWDAYICRGNANQGLGHLEVALADFSQAIELAPHLDAVSYWRRGSVHSQLRHYPEAIADFSQALQRQPDLLDARWQRGIAYVYSGQEPLAVTDFEQIVQAAPSGTAYYCLAIIQGSLGQFEAAKDSINEALKLDPTLASAYYVRGNLSYHPDNSASALADFQQAIALEQAQPRSVVIEDPHYLYERALALYRMGDSDAALSDLNQAGELCETYQYARFLSQVNTLFTDIHQGGNSVD
jgi:tetratricopeptide (TPR) repeat protein